MERLRNWLRESRHTVVFTGAGMSTESGLPDFRSARTGLWQGKDPARLASTQAMRHNREEFLAFYRMRIEGLLSCKPHSGHHLLAEWERQGVIQGIITQNVDGYHQHAGSQRVAELHGTLTTLSCLRCGRKEKAARYLQEEGSVCECGGFLRPDVVLFGESLPEAAFEQAVAWTEPAELFLVLGSSLAVSPANWFPQQAKERGATLVIVNREPTMLDHLADLVIQDRLIGDVLKNLPLDF
ncbi:NAD-dependent deacylase [Brevibacillus composti]|uniref:NAD-dependent protein deacetylase n=1 Tax=Brevibacillus composti TaxID=2796470 RepID=A0A7T5EIC8_9BACL|nr:NAD-dependent deacylase [Brevibacillus composti]QQE73174.1 NAD-dependent deacylase [Brevibacillus composti]QUO40253.1 NAD-dependent deacylase [Brevibacillus composti]